MHKLGLKANLALLVAAAVLPLALFAAVMVYRVAADSRAKAEERLADVAATLALAVDSKIEAAIATLTTLAASPAFAEGDLATFETYVRTLAKQLNSTIVLTDRSGQMLINTRRPPGSTLPRHSAPELVERIVAAGKPVTSDVFFGQLVQEFSVTVNVPVFRDGQVAAVLDIPFDIAALSRALETPALAPATVVTLIDAKGTIVARSRDAATYVGKPVADWVKAAAAQGRRYATGRRSDGLDVVAAVQSLAQAPWILAVSLPEAALRAESERILTLFGAGALGLMALAVAGAALFSRRLARPIRALARAAPNILESETQAVRGAHAIAEIATLDTALRRAAAAARAGQAERERTAAAEARADALAQSDQALRASAARLRESEERLRQSEAQLRLSLDASAAGTWSWNAVTNEATWDERYHDQYGFAPDTPRSFEAWIGRVHPDDRARLRARLQTLIETPGDDLWMEEFRIQHPTRGQRWMTGIGRAARDAAGRVIHLAGISLDITERKEAEAALRESEAHLRTALEAAELMPFSRDFRTGAIRWDRRIKQIWGLPEDAEPTDDLILAGLHPDDRCKVRAALDRAQDPQGDGKYEVEYRVVNLADRTERWVFSRAQALLEDGRPTLLVGAMLDITERKQVENKLRDGAALLRSATENASVGLVMLDRQRRYTFVNSPYIKILGLPYSATELIGKGPAEVLAPVYATQIAPRLDRAFAGERVTYELTRPPAVAGGEPSYYDVVYEPLRDERGVNGVIVTIFDITERKEAEEALRTSENRLRQAQAASRVGIFDTDLVTGRMTWDARLRELWGLPADLAMTPELVRAGIHPDDRARVQAALGRAQDPAGTGSYAAEYRVIARDGTERWVAATAQVSFAEGRAVRIIGTVTDISERKATERRQHLLMREVDHRAKNALAVATGLLRMTKANSVKEFIDIAQKRVGALARVHSLLAENLWDGAPLVDLIKRELAAYLMQGTRVRLDGPPLVVAPAAAQSLSMALHELATNATKYGALSTPKGRVDVTWTETDAGVTLIWKESGGPQITPPTTKGFGTQVIEQVTHYQLEGDVVFDWPQTGLVSTLHLPTTCFAGGGEHRSWEWQRVGSAP